MRKDISRFLAWALILSLTLPLPMAGHAASSGDAVSGGSRLERQGGANTALPGSHVSSPQTRKKDADYDAARVHARLNSPERKAAIEEARRIDAAAREAFAAQEAGAAQPFATATPARTPANVVPATQGAAPGSVIARSGAEPVQSEAWGRQSMSLASGNSEEERPGLPRQASGLPHNDKNGLPRQASGLPRNDKNGLPRQASGLPRNDKNGLPRQASGLPRNDKSGGVIANTPDSSSSALAATPDSSALSLRDGPQARRGNPSSSSSRPKTITEVMFNAATGVVGLPGLAGNQHDPYDPNADQGLGFHADGTARRADGTTGTNAASAGYNGKRAASYANHGAGSGLGYSAYGGMGGNGQYGYQEPGYDPVTGQNYRYGDPTNGGRRTMGQGGYGNLDQFDPNRMLMQRGLNYGVGLANSAAEGLFLGLMESDYAPGGGARARFNFMVDWDGKVNGEGDLLLPWWDSKYTTVYSQFGARSMSGASSGGSDGRGADRWIGNFGLGQRWYPLAVNDGTDNDAGTLMLGYNAFFDNDFTRSHQRGGLGIEGQYDWLHLASNYYFPLSSWKGSEDFDSNFVKERPAEGWDIRAKGYLPFYRNVALTGAYTQWYGDNVGMFGAKNLEKDPKIWSYGLEYTPVPLVSGFVNQRQSEQGRSDTEFGLRLTYHFQMPWEDQIRHDKVAQLRTVGGSRHEFVDRENKIILEYKAKNNFHVEYLGKVGTNQFKFRIRNGFDKYVAGQQVRVSASGGVTLAEAPTSPGAAPTTFLAQAGDFISDLFSVKAAHAADFSQTYTTDGNGEFIVRLDNVLSIPVVLTIQAGNTSQSVTLHEATVTGGLTAASSTLANSASTTLTFTGPANTAVAWAVVSGPGTVNPASSNTNASGVATATLTGNATGFGPIEVKATVNSTDYTARVTIDKTLSLTADAANPVVNTGETKTLKFIVRQNGVAMPNSAVTLSTSGPGTVSTTSVTTNGSGEFSVDLTGSAAGTVTITATVALAGSAPATVAVGSATVLTLTPDNSSQTFPVGTTRSNEGFTLKDNGTPLAAGVAVTLAYAGPGAFASPPTTATTTSGGKIALNLKGQTAGNVTITATANGKSANYMLTVTAATVLSLTQDSPQNFPAGATVNNVAFTLTDGGQPVQSASLTLAWSNTGGAFNAPPANASTDGSGKFTLASLTGQTPGSVTLTATLPGPDNRTVTCPLSVVVAPYVLSFDQPGGYNPSFSGSGASNKASQTVVITVRQNGSPVGAGVAVSLTPSMNDAANQAIVSDRRTQYYGLTANSSAGGASFPGISPLTTNGSGQVTLNLEDIVGERILGLTASATPSGGSAATVSASVTFGAGPLAKFKAPLSGLYRWANNNPISNGSNANTSDFPAANACGTTLSASDLRSLSDGYHDTTKLPSQSDLKAVAQNTGNGAWQAAGWPDISFWTGEVSGGGNVAFIVYGNGGGIPGSVYNDLPVVCLR